MCIRDSFYTVFDGSTYENGKIKSSSRQPNCGVNVKDANVIDQGVWACNVYFQDGSNYNTYLIRQIIVILVSQEVSATHENVNNDVSIGTTISVVIAIFLLCVCGYISIACYLNKQKHIQLIHAVFE